MTLKITGDFGGLQRMTEEAGRFTKALERYKPTCNLLDPASVEEALRQLDNHVDSEARRYPGNKMVQGMMPKLKEALRKGVLEEARKAQSQA